MLNELRAKFESEGVVAAGQCEEHQAAPKRKAVTSRQRAAPAVAIAAATAPETGGGRTRSGKRFRAN